MLALRMSAISVLTVAFLAAGPAYGQGFEVFSIGKKDNSFSEFVREKKTGHPVVYRVGESAPGKDWYAYQPGTFDYQVGRSTMQQDWTAVNPGSNDHLTEPFPEPSEVIFPLQSVPAGTFILELEAIFRYRHPAAPRFALLINGHTAASFQLVPHPAPELWWPNGGEADGNTQYFGYQTLRMELPASAFVKGENSISMRCLDGFGFYYDHLGLLNDRRKTPSRVIESSVEPTIFYKTRPTGLVELAIVKIRTSRPIGRTRLKIEVGSSQLASEVNQSEFGDVESTIEVPASDAPIPIALYLPGRKTPIYKGTFHPKRRWQVYALPMEQADFGYNDLPSRTLEWENRFIDKTLEIQSQYPSYSFTLDAAANLESYIATRKNKHRQDLLGHLRSGKFGINALYANFFTGLATPEELLRTLDYGVKAGRRYGFTVDSASQTDEPSATWALPQILAGAGIKYFTNGSDPIRGAMNPIGHLNFRSPFYWESPTGSKVLMWSGISYTAIDDMTWGGWNAESARTGVYHPSLLGLTRSLPLFLSQYERDDFPFDAVLLFGLHNDEIPMRHWGDADVMEMWNREYAFPKIIPGTQRDFFGHITKHFEAKIPTFRGDGGAYWEDEAGADARVAAMIRSSQYQIVAAEKFESIASWLQPHLEFDHRPFDAAWKNILLADSYVWSDANSFRRPYSYRTQMGEAAHRAWAESALQQTRDLRLVAMDKIADQIQTDEQGIVVLNAESWPRSDFFDAELEMDEALTDPVTKKSVPCGAMKMLNGYQEVRCWGMDIPALGYKFYAIRKGKIPSGELLAADSVDATFENQYFKLQIEPVTGAVAHLVDKSSNLDLVNSDSGYRLNEYLYVSGGEPGDFFPESVKDNRILAADVTLPLPQLEIHRATLTNSPQARRFPWGIEITIHSTSQNTLGLYSTITLTDFKKQVNFDNEVQKTSTLRKEGIYFAFPFALQKPRMKYQGATAWVNPETDMLPGANLQWFTTQGAVWAESVENRIAWATADAPLITLQDINRGLWPESIHIQNGTVFSYAMNNYWYTDAPAQQGGNFQFRYALTSGTNITSTQAVTLSAEQRSPLLAIRRYNMGWKPTLPANGAGFVSASPAGVTVLTIRAIEDSDEFLVCVQNLNPKELQAEVQLPMFELEDAYLGSHIGDKLGTVEWTSHSVALPLNAYEIKSVVLRVKQNRDLR